VFQTKGSIFTQIFERLPKATTTPNWTRDEAHVIDHVTTTTITIGWTERLESHCEKSAGEVFFCQLRDLRCPCVNFRESWLAWQPRLRLCGFSLRWYVPSHLTWRRTMTAGAYITSPCPPQTIQSSGGLTTTINWHPVGLTLSLQLIISCASGPRPIYEPITSTFHLSCSHSNTQLNPYYHLKHQVLSIPRLLCPANRQNTSIELAEKHTLSHPLDRYENRLEVWVSPLSWRNFCSSQRGSCKSHAIARPTCADQVHWCSPALHLYDGAQRLRYIWSFIVYAADEVFEWTRCVFGRCAILMDGWNWMARHCQLVMLTIDFTTNSRHSFPYDDIPYEAYRFRIERMDLACVLELWKKAWKGQYGI